MHVNQKHELHAKSCSCNQSLLPTEIVPFVDNIGEDGWWDWHIQEDYEYMSPRFWELLGYNPEEMPNHPSAWKEKIFIEDLEISIKNFNKHCETHGKYPYKQEVRYRHKDGSTIYVICKGRVIEWDDNGNAIRMVGTHTNITKLKEQEQKIQKMSKRFEKQALIFREIFSISPTPTFLCDPDGKVIDLNYNAEKLLEAPKSTIIGMKFTDFTHPEDINNNIQAIRRAKENGMPQHFQKRYITAKQNSVLCSTIVNYIENNGNSYFIIQLADITERQAVKEKVLATLDNLREIARR
jgi:PAS domain S-box-containing protein